MTLLVLAGGAPGWGQRGSVVPLRPGPEINTLDPALKGDQLALKSTVKVKFPLNSREYRFDFAFSAHSIDSSATR